MDPNPIVSAATVVFTAWRDVVLSMIASDPEAPDTGASPKSAAAQEWEDEGGRIKPEKK